MSYEEILLCGKLNYAYLKIPYACLYAGLQGGKFKKND